MHLDFSFPPTNMLLTPAQRTFTAAELVQGGKFRGRSNADSMDARATEISSIVYAQVLEVLRLYAPDTVHVFTHAGNDVPTESSRGLYMFVNRNYYYSALRRHAVVDNYTETVIPIDIASGTLSFQVETNLTSKVNKGYKYIKDVANGKVEWDTVAVNTKEGPGTYSVDTHVFVSFGFGLKKCLEDGTITFNPRGLVTGPQERKPIANKPRSPNVQPVQSHTPTTKRKMESSHTSEKNMKFHKMSNAQKADAAIVRHTDMAQKLSNYDDCADTRHQEINYQEVNSDEP